MGQEVIDQDKRYGHVGFLITLSVLLVVVALTLILMEPHDAAPYVQMLLGVLAMVGVFSLFAGAIGLVQLGLPSAQNNPMTFLLDSLEDGICVVDTAGRTLFANKAYLGMMGSNSVQEVCSLERAFVSGDAELIKPMFLLSQAARERIPAVEDIRTTSPLFPNFPNDTGSFGSYWYRISVRPIQFEEKTSSKAEEANKGATLWRIVDISSQRDRQESEFQELQQVVTFLDNAPAGFFASDTYGNVNYINATLANWLGYDLAQTNTGNLKVQNLVSGYMVVPWLQHQVLDRSKTSSTSVVDVDFLTKTGHKLPVRLLHRPSSGVLDRGGTRDILTLVLNRSAGEEAGEVSEALRAAEVRFARFFNDTPIAMVSVGRQGKIYRANSSFLGLFGSIMKPDGTNHLITDYLAEQDRRNLTKIIEDTIARKNTVPSIEVQLAVEQGKQRFVRCFVSSVGSEENDEEAAVIYSLETTQQRELEQQFAQSQKMQGIGQLAGGIAHDFNNMLTAIIGFSDLLLSNHRPSDPSFQDIMNIKHNANRAASLVRQLLAFSRRQTMRPEVLHLMDTIAELSIMLDRLLGEKVELRVTHGRNLWPIKADSIQLEQVIVNLAVNARDAMPDGGKLLISTSNIPKGTSLPYETPGMPDEDYVSIEVSDTGVGMSQALLEKIFEPFFTTKTTGQGTGLGLSTVYGIVKQTGGYIYCTSTEGEGSTFYILLPRHEEDLEETETKQTPQTETKQIEDLTGSAKILLVEDEESVRTFAKRALSARGYTVYEAASGTQALAILQEQGHDVDLLVSDVVMPEMDGPTLLKELRKIKPELKIIFVSGYAEDAFAKHLLEGESFHFLSKPLTLKQLVVTVKNVLNS